MSELTLAEQSINERSSQLQRRKINPLTLIIINAVLPVVTMFFPTDKSIIVGLCLGYIALFIARRYMAMLKALIWIAAGVMFILLNSFYIKSSVLGMMINMTVYFTPCILIAVLIVTDYNSSEILSALQRLHLPKIFIIGLTITIRYIPTFRREFRIIKQAMHIRGVEFSVKHPLRTFEYLLVPQLFRCVSLSAELTAAGLTKGIATEEKRTSYFDNQFHGVDYVMFAIGGVGLVLIIGGLL
ncbi:energy-coupling factor transporter transmembrane component T [Mogibacterium neglectum]|jgi:ABC-type cobalt transport system, permease component CbiQ and related transporters|uniref:energy-coupling factor transporter transmembrane component T n=1 Tax=Mogibacterium neglectum TaxID=114528 RepID=UPI00272C87FB|nr:energy-coupling factor transporter transmembrane component T [Mogibacterium neglectum]WLD75960.1 energy-coupling factor transporter transmembrane component T [Mogibacterium neglectum]